MDWLRQKGIHSIYWRIAVIASAGPVLLTLIFALAKALIHLKASFFGIGDG